MQVNRRFCGILPCLILSLAGNSNLYGQTSTSNSYNYIVRNILLIDEKNESNISNLSITSAELQQSITYFDGLGREMQQVVRSFSPGSKKDIVTPIIYDDFGRKVLSYLPYESSQSNGYYIPTAVTGQTNFYALSTTKAGVARDGKPYGKTDYDNSPLNRVTATYGPGTDWQNNGKKVSYVYRTNAASEVRQWSYNTSTKTATSNTPEFYSFQNSEGVLYVTEITDEASHKTIEYKDKQNRVVLKKVQDNSGYLYTYYIYDDFGNLRMVIPPKASELLSLQSAGSKSLTESNAKVKNFCFTYDYDAKQRMIEKKVPGADPVYMVYDQRDRLVFTQDGVQHAKPTPEWTFTKYDALNRPVMTGIYKSESPRASLQTTIDGKTTYAETRTSSAVGYTLTNVWPTVTEADLLTITYYDDYDFTGNSGWDAEGLSYGYVGDYTALPAPKLTKVKGQATGSKVKVLGQSKWLNAVSYYDSRYRVIQTVQENHLGGYDRMSSLYDFTGNVLKTKRTHNDGTNNLTVNEEYDYDHAKRLIAVKHQIGNDGPLVTLSQQEYNAIGELVNKDLHFKQGDSGFMQSVDYRYNIRGWLESINRPNLAHDPTSNPDIGKPSDLFGMELLYQKNTAGLP